MTTAAKIPAPQIDPALYATTGRTYTATDADGTEYAIVKSAEFVRTVWTIYYADGLSVRRLDSAYTLRAARARVASILPA